MTGTPWAVGATLFDRAGATLLDRMIARLTAQRDALNWAVERVEGCSGPVLEIGLGKGRTYDYLRARLGVEQVYAFDDGLRVPPGCEPPSDRLFLGDFRDTLAAARATLGGAVRLAHADFGSPDQIHDREQAAWLAPMIDALMQPGGVVVSDRPLSCAGWQPVEPPGSGPAWRYHAWVVRPGDGQVSRS